jgi:hypothetical protein
MEFAMALTEQLTNLRKTFEAKAEPAVVETMHRGTEELRNSGILERVLKKGNRAPEFTLPDSAGTMVSSAALLRKGPLVVSFFRGKW